MRYALLLLACLGGCAAPGAAPPPAPTTAPTATPTAPAVRDPATIDIVGSAYLVRTKTDVAPPASPFLDLWLRAARLDPEAPDLVYAMTGDGGASALFCRAGDPLDPAKLRQEAASLPPTDSTRVAIDYALANPAYLRDADMALLTRRPGADTRAACSKAGIAYRSFTLGLVACDSGVCPVVLLLKEDRVSASPAMRRLLAALAGPGGVLADPVALAEAGMQPLRASDRTRIQAAIAALLAGNDVPAS